MWRRKIGVCTLVLACVLTAGWVRSVGIVDQCTIPLLKHRKVICGSHSQYILCATQYDSLPDETSYPFLQFDWASAPTAAAIDLFTDSGALMWNWGCLGIGIGVLSPHPVPIIQFSTLRAIPYRLITIPLTLISLWLLLAKPRTSTQKRTTDPAVNAVA